jgi:hypothetical protein
MANPAAIAPAVMAPTFVLDFVRELSCGAVEEIVDVECAVSTTVEPDCVIVNVGGFPVAMGPTVAEPAAGCVAVAPPREEPPITD